MVTQITIDEAKRWASPDLGRLNIGRPDAQDIGGYAMHPTNANRTPLRIWTRHILSTLGEAYKWNLATVAEKSIAKVVDGLSYGSERLTVPENARLFIYSDGAFEISRPDGSMWRFPEFLASLIAPVAAPHNRMDRLISEIRAISCREEMSDDFSMIELAFRD